MWLARDLVRFVVLIVLAALLGAAFGAFWHTAHGGDLLSSVRGGLVVVAGLTLLLGAAPGARRPRVQPYLPGGLHAAR